jgi:hypothetical protein
LGERWGDETPRTQIVFIGAPGSVTVEELRGQFDACRADAYNPARALLADVVEWVREL